NNFVKFQMERLGVAVLRVLDEKDHEKSDDGRSGIDDELPGIREMERGAGGAPDDDDQDGRGKCPGAAKCCRGTAGEDAKRVAHDAKEVSFRLLLPQFFLLSFFGHDNLSSLARDQLRASIQKCAVAFLLSAATFEPWAMRFISISTMPGRSKRFHFQPVMRRPGVRNSASRRRRN